MWDDTLAKTAEDWAHACLWEHGPPNLLRFLGQNLSVRTGRWVTFDPSSSSSSSSSPFPDICCSSQGRLCLSLSSHGRCPAAPFFSPLKAFALWPGDCLRNAPVTLHINKSCVSSHDPWGQRRRPFSGSWLSIWKHRAPSRVLHFEILLRSKKTRGSREFVCWQDLVTHTESAIGRIY